MTEPSKPLDLVQAAAEAAGQEAPTLTGLAERVAKMEAAFEQLGQAARFQTELALYVGDLREEASAIQSARKTVGRTIIGAAVILFLAPVAIAIAKPTWYMTLPVYLAASLMLGMFAAGVLLLTTMARSVFRSAHERQGDEFIPPQIKAIHELTTTLKG